MALYITEIFKSIQGESSYQGEPCIFVRLSGCNLRCSYCDTKYSYKNGTQMDIDKIISEVKKLNCRLVEITGGEPLLQADTSILAKKLLDENFKVLLETNGSISFKGLPSDIIKITDIKTPSSGMADKVNIGNFNLLNAQDEIKFVLSNKDDYEWAKKFISKYELTSKCKVLFSSVFNTFPYSELADLINEDNLPVRLNLQLHKIIWGENSRK